MHGTLTSWRTLAVPLYRLMLEEHKDVFPALLEAVQEAVAKLAVPEGPTFLNVTDENGSWAQAGGTNGCYRVEARSVYGGFQHVMAARRDCRDRRRGLGLAQVSWPRSMRHETAFRRWIAWWRRWSRP